MIDSSALLDFVGLYLIPGLITGCIYALGAIGVSLLFGILRFAHFAHGDVMTLGGYLALTFVWWLGWPVLAAIPLAMIGTALVAVGLDRAFYRPFRRRPTIISVIASFGVMLMIRSAIQLIWGVEPMQYKAGIERPIILFGQLRLQERHIWMIAITAVLVLALHLMLSRSRIGRAMRAVSDEPDLARVTGISTERVILVTWLVGGRWRRGRRLPGHGQQIDPTGLGHAAAHLRRRHLWAASAAHGGGGRGLVLGLIEELSTYNWIGRTRWSRPTTSWVSPSPSW
jgi:ABC-type branched-subunit amino acid transport system permease subunit